MSYNTFQDLSFIEELPKNWDVRKFSDIFTDVSGGNVKLQKSDFQTTGKYPIIDQGQSFIAGYTSDTNALCNTTLPVIVFGDHTRAFKYISFKFVMGADGTKVLQPNGDAKVEVKYVYHFLKSVKLPDKGYSRHFKYLKDVALPLPPLSEQKRIAAILDKAEEIKRKREESLKLADEFLKSVFVDMFGDPVTNPKGWERAPLGRLTKIDAPMVDPKKKEYLDLIHIAPNNIEKCTGQLLPAKTAREDNLISGKFLFTEKHVLYSKIRPYLRKGALPDFSGLCSADMYPIEPIKNVLTREYLLFILLSDAFDDYTKTIPGRANIPKINRTELNAYETIVPDYALQKDFSKIYRKIKERREHLANTDFENKLFGSLSQKAFNGDL